VSTCVLRLEGRTDGKLQLAGLAPALAASDFAGYGSMEEGFEGRVYGFPACLDDVSLLHYFGTAYARCLKDYSNIEKRDFDGRNAAKDLGRIRRSEKCVYNLDPIALSSYFLSLIVEDSIVITLHYSSSSDSPHEEADSFTIKREKGGPSLAY
jgi:hypothetical protein